MITLQSSDGEIFEVDEVVAVESNTIKHMIEDGFVECVIPVPNVTGTTLAKVIEYCKKHVEAKANDKGKRKIEEEHLGTVVNNGIKSWDAGFVELDQTRLYDLLMVRYFYSLLFPPFLVLFCFFFLFINFLDCLVSKVSKVKRIRYWIECIYI